jgi:hypothetical protein
MDEEGLGWDEAWAITGRCASFFCTNFWFLLRAETQWQNSLLQTYCV